LEIELESLYQDQIYDSISRRSRGGPLCGAPPPAPGMRDCVAITLRYFVEKRGLLKSRITNFFKNLGVKSLPKKRLFSLFSNYDTV